MARPARLATTNVTDWKQEQKEDPVLYQVAKHLRAPCETFKAVLHKVLDKKPTATYVKASKGATTDQERPPVLEDPAGAGRRDCVPICSSSEASGRCPGWLPPRGGSSRPAPLYRPHVGTLLVVRHDSRPQKPH